MNSNLDVNALQELLKDSELSTVIGCYLEPGGAGPQERYRLFSDRLQSKRFVVPVAGVQGSGKSTFLNAIAFGTTVLPIDADETTAVPVEIAWAPKPDGAATVHFRDGHLEKVSATEADLRRFVHNNYNPGNQLQVDRIVIFSDAPIFKNGLVLVDLPGVGSLTETNIETTRKYLMDAVGVVFLLRTVPPMTRSDTIFVAANWVRLPMAFFVLNRWTDESDEEVEDGLGYTIEKLGEIVKENHIPLTTTPVVSVVVAYRALEGRLKDDALLLEKSGMNLFISQFGQDTRNWAEGVVIGIREALRGDIEAAKETIGQQRLDFSSDRVSLEARIVSEEARFEEYTQKLQQLLDSVEAEGVEFVHSTEGRIDEWAVSARHTLRNNMRNKLRGGIVDGKRLSEALMAEQGEEADRIYEEFQEKIMGFEDRLRERFKDFPSWRAERPDLRETVIRPEKRKWENLAPPILNAGGGLGGMWAGAKAAGAIGGVVGGPVGGIVGAVVGGIIGGLFGGWLGSKTKKGITNIRANEVEPAVFRAIDKFIEETRKHLSKEVKDFAGMIEGSLKGWRDEQQARYETQRMQSMMDLQSTKADKENRVNRLNADEAVLNRAFGRLDQLPA